MQTTGHGPVSLDLSDCLVDAVEIERVFKAGAAQATTERLSEVCDLFGGDLLEGVEIDGNPEFAGWLIAQRQRYREMNLALLRELVSRLPRASEETFRRLDQWLVLAPFDVDAHAAMVDVLLGCGRVRDAEQHVAAAIRAFEQEGLDWSPLRALLAERKSAAGSARADASRRRRRPSTHPRRRRRSRGDRASVAIMPFAEVATGDGSRRLADGLTDDIITRLAKLRILFVIARGTTYALGERGVGAHEAGRILDVEYVVSGSVRTDDRRIFLVVELAETRHATIVWREELETSTDGTFAALDTIVDRVVAGIAEEIETAECKRAILQAPSSLDAWEAYHRGLWHMYKFSEDDNRHAADLFERALQLDPTFARAWAGLSFTHFQNVFLDLTPGSPARDRARPPNRAAQRGRRRSRSRRALVDGPSALAQWREQRVVFGAGAKRGAEPELRTRTLHTRLSFTVRSVIRVRRLRPCSIRGGSARSTRCCSPCLPVEPSRTFGWASSRKAAEWASKAAGRPNAHEHVLAVAAACLVLAGRRDDARRIAARIQERLPGYGTADFLRAFRFDADTQRTLVGSLRQLASTSRNSAIGHAEEPAPLVYIANAPGKKQTRWRPEVPVGSKSGAGRAGPPAVAQADGAWERVAMAPAMQHRSSNEDLQDPAKSHMRLRG